ncbi:motile sperm domain-containing protein 2-like protein [Dinothrombium tinctorium]|uniref:Motile sperm domain-containing protein 2-like protein n=1 Tax=Dinothrombium tinctorium TaxID=1965070 RepID=A0A3S3NNU2_9ACAR|nr:motile sperm domain-containing protein 2-like protein [Dinothrombium tinctorium]
MFSFIAKKRNPVETNIITSSYDSADENINFRENIEELILKVKSALREDMDENEENYDNKDAEVFIESSEFDYIERFLIKNDYDVTKTVSMMKKTLQWRKISGLSQMSDTSFPDLFYRLGLVFIHKQDVDGDFVFYSRMRLKLKTHNEIEERFKLFLFYHLFKVDQLAAKIARKYIIVIDCTQTQLQNIDIANMLWCLNVYINKYPAGLKYVIVYNLPWFARAIFTATIKLLPEWFKSLIKRVEKDALFNYIPIENVPSYLNGHDVDDPRFIPENDCYGLKEFFHNVSETVLNKEVEHFEKLLASVWN